MGTRRAPSLPRGGQRQLQGRAAGSSLEKDALSWAQGPEQLQESSPTQMLQVDRGLPQEANQAVPLQEELAGLPASFSLPPSPG